MTDHTVPVLPVTHPAAGAGHFSGHHDGLEPSGAALVQGNHLAVNGQIGLAAVKDAQIEAARSSKEAVETRFSLERSVKENMVQAERLERENQSAVRAEIANLRQTMADQEQRRLVERENDRRFAGIETTLARILERLPVANGG